MPIQHTSNDIESTTCRLLFEYSHTGKSGATMLKSKLTRKRQKSQYQTCSPHDKYRTSSISIGLTSTCISIGTGVTSDEYQFGSISMGMSTLWTIAVRSGEKWDTGETNRWQVGHKWNQQDDEWDTRETNKRTNGTQAKPIRWQVRVIRWQVGRPLVDTSETNQFNSI